MKKVGTGQWVGWLGAAVIAATGSAFFLALGPTGFTPEVPMLNFANANPGRVSGIADRKLRAIESAAARGDVGSRRRNETDLSELMSESQAEAFRLLERYESGEFDGTEIEGAVLESLLLSGREEIVERAMDAARRREIELHAARGLKAALEAVENDAVAEIEKLGAEDLDDPRIRLDVESAIAEPWRSSESRIAAIRTLARARDASVTEFLLNQLDAESASELRQAIAMSLMLRPDARVADALAKLLSNPSETVAVRRLAAQGLSQQANMASARVALLEAFDYQESDDSLRSAIVNGLGAFPSDSLVEQALIWALMDDPCESVQVAAAISLMNSPTERSRDALQHAIDTTESVEVRMTAERTLSFLEELLAGEQRAATVELTVGPR